MDGYLLANNIIKFLEDFKGIKLCEALRSQFGLDVISLMLTNLYGPNDNYLQAIAI